MHNTSTHTKAMTQPHTPQSIHDLKGRFVMWVVVCSSQAEFIQVSKLIWLSQFNSRPGGLPLSLPASPSLFPLVWIFLPSLVHFQIYTIPPVLYFLSHSPILSSFHVSVYLCLGLAEVRVYSSVCIRFFTNTGFILKGKLQTPPAVFEVAVQVISHFIYLKCPFICVFFPFSFFVPIPQFFPSLVLLHFLIVSFLSIFLSQSFPIFFFFFLLHLPSSSVHVESDQQTHLTQLQLFELIIYV